MQANQTDKTNFSNHEKELVHKLSVKEGELISLRRQFLLSEKSKNESDRKDHVIEGM